MNEAQADRMIAVLEKIEKKMPAPGGTTTGAVVPKATTTSGAPAGKPALPTRPVTLAALQAVQAAFDLAAGQKIVREQGKAAKFDLVKRDNYPAILLECERVLNPPADGEDSLDDSGTGEEDTL